MKYLFLALALVSSFSFQSKASGDYWSDIVELCRNYSAATHPPCHKANGARMILGEVARSCEGDDDCLNEAVEICLNYSPATHPPCNASNGLRMVLGEIERCAQFYK